MNSLIQYIETNIINFLLFSGSTAIIIYYIAKHFGKKWIENQFAKELEEFKRRQSEMLEFYRFEINSKFNRITKIHEKEFEVLPQAWYKLQSAYMEYLNISSPFQSWPNLNRYSTVELEAFIEKCDLLDFQKNEILKVDDKLSFYKEKIYWIRLNTARSKLNDFRLYLKYNKIFLSQDLFKLFSDIERIMLETEATFETMQGDEHWKDHYEMFKKLKDNGSSILADLENAVQSRLHFNNN